jgi:hypothetical protein
MRKLIVSEFITLDGVIQSPGYPDEDPSGGFEAGGWQQRYFDDVFGRAAMGGLAASGACCWVAGPMRSSRGIGRSSRRMTRLPRSSTASPSTWCRPR